jgi:hypothetical protein
LQDEDWHLSVLEEVLSKHALPPGAEVLTNTLHIDWINVGIGELHEVPEEIPVVGLVSNKAGEIKEDT